MAYISTTTLHISTTNLDLCAQISKLYSVQSQRHKYLNHWKQQHEAERNPTVKNIKNKSDCKTNIIVTFTISTPGDLKTRKRTGTSCQIEIHFSIKTTKFLFKYTLHCSQIYDRFIILFIKHNHKVSASFIKEKQRYK